MPRNKKDLVKQLPVPRKKNSSLRPINVGDIVVVTLGSGREISKTRAEYLGHHHDSSKLYWVRLLSGDRAQILVGAGQIRAITRKRTMNLRQFREQTKDLPDDTELVYQTMLGDAIPLYAVETNHVYQAKSDIEGYAYSLKCSAADHRMTDAQWEKVKQQSKPAIVFTNKET